MWQHHSVPVYRRALHILCFRRLVTERATLNARVTFCEPWRQCIIIFFCWLHCRRIKCARTATRRHSYHGVQWYAGGAHNFCAGFACVLHPEPRTRTQAAQHPAHVVG